MVVWGKRQPWEKQGDFEHPPFFVKAGRVEETPPVRKSELLEALLGRRPGALLWPRPCGPREG